MKIFKYEIPMDGITKLEMSKGAKVLTVQIQNEKVFIWALVNEEENMVVRTFRLIGTGHDILDYNDGFKYIGTFQLDGGGFIGHLFEIK